MQKISKQIINYNVTPQTALWENEGTFKSKKKTTEENAWIFRLCEVGRLCLSLKGQCAGTALMLF